MVRDISPPLTNLSLEFVDKNFLSANFVQLPRSRHGKNPHKILDPHRDPNHHKNLSLSRTSLLQKNSSKFDNNFLGHRANRKTNGGKTYKCFSSWLTQQGVTRGHRKKLCKPLCKISAFIAGIYCHRVNFNIWNALPDIVVTAPSATSVKKRLSL